MFSGLDHAVMQFAGSFAGRSRLFDDFIVKFLDLYAVKLLPMMALLVFLWFRTARRKESRQTVVVAIAAMLVAVAISRAVQDLSPHRLRPLHSGDPAFVTPYGLDPSTLEHWSSFPSDHAAVVFALSTAIFALSRRLGLIAYVWSIVIVCLPRLYGGYHYASDSLGGAMIGIVAALVVMYLLPTRSITERASGVEARYPGLFNAGLFMLMYFFATMFEEVRHAVSYLLL